MYDIKDIGKRITAYRKNLGMTQEDLAVKLNISAQAISKWETGLSLPDIAVLPELAKAFNTSMDKLFGEEGNSRIATGGVSLLNKPVFPEFKTSTMKLVHSFNDVGCYSEKEVSVTNEISVFFKDGSSADLKSLKVVNKGPGDICFDFIDIFAYADIDYNKNELHEVFDGIASVDMNIIEADYEVTKSGDAKTHVDVYGSPQFIAMLGISKNGDTLDFEYRNNNNNSGSRSGGKANKVVIAFGKDMGDHINARINGCGQCKISIPFKKGVISINGSGVIFFENIFNAECKINGSGDIKCVKAGNPVISINGSGDFRADTVSGSLKAVIRGSGDIYVGEGEIDTLEARISGSGNVNAEKVCTGTANLAISGAGRIVIGRVTGESVEQHSKNCTIRILKRG